MGGFLEMLDNILGALWLICLILGFYLLFFGSLYLIHPKLPLTYIIISTTSILALYLWFTYQESKS